MRKDYTNTLILNTLELPIIKSPSDFSNKIGLSKYLIYLLSNYNRYYYKKLYIKKSSGLLREILSPSYSMKMVQRWILETILYKIKVSDIAYAYRPKGFGKAIVKNAELHQHSLYIMQLDMKDFFPSITRDKVFYVFRNIGYNKLMSNIFADICTYEDYLPQGAITSPYLSNIICYKLDRRLMGLCGKRDVIFSRYADDLTFSCDNKNTLRRMKNIVCDIVTDEGFQINEDKTRFLSPGSRKRITGVTINDGKLKAPKEYKRKVRAMIHNAIISQDYSNSNKIKGYIAYINSIEEGYIDKVKEYLKGFQEKDIVYFDDIVNSFNENKLFLDLGDLRKEEFDLLDENDIFDYKDAYLADIICMREQFINKRKTL